MHEFFGLLSVREQSCNALNRNVERHDIADPSWYFGQLSAILMWRVTALARLSVVMLWPRKNREAILARGTATAK